MTKCDWENIKWNKVRAKDFYLFALFYNENHKVQILPHLIVTIE